LVGRFGPFEGPGILVVPIDESADIGFEFPDRGMNTSLEPLSGEFSEPAFDGLIHDAEVGVKCT
jgi:hypothetical protein